MAIDYTKRRFFIELAMRAPKLTEIVNHKKFKICLEMSKELFRLCPTEATILLVGPTHVGKSQLLAYLVAFLDKEIYRDADANDRPIIGCSAITSREGRTAPKFLLQELLEDVGHPFFQMDPIPTAEQLYKPTGKSNETYHLRSLKGATHARNVETVIVDDAHYLTRAKDEEFKASLLESLKGIVTPRTTLLTAGGYELASVGMAYRTHFAERLLVVHFPRYGNGKDDVYEWRSIVANFAQSPKLHFDSPDVLPDLADRLRRECHGVVGILEKRLILTQAHAAAEGEPISAKMLKATRPADVQWQTTEADIISGEKLLGTKVAIIDVPMNTEPDSVLAERKASKTRKGKKKSGIRMKRPFERAPSRSLPAVHT